MDFCIELMETFFFSWRPLSICLMCFYGQEIQITTGRQRDCADAIVLGTCVTELEYCIYVYLKKKKNLYFFFFFTSLKRKISGEMTDRK